VRAAVPAAQAGEAAGVGLEIVGLATLREAIERLLGEKVEPLRAEAAPEARPAARAERV